MPYMTCFECGAVYDTPEELVERHLAVLDDLGIVADEQDKTGETIYVCPECTHDF